MLVSILMMWSALARLVHTKLIAHLRQDNTGADHAPAESTADPGAATEIALNDQEDNSSPEDDLEGGEDKTRLQAAKALQALPVIGQDHVLEDDE